MVPGNAECNFDNPAENFSLKVRKLFAYSSEKFIIFQTKMFLWTRRMQL